MYSLKQTKEAILSWVNGCMTEDNLGCIGDAVENCIWKVHHRRNTLHELNQASDEIKQAVERRRVIISDKSHVEPDGTITYTEPVSNH